MKTSFKSILLITALLIIIQPGFSQKKTKYSPYVKKEMYKPGWIDFNKNGRMDPFENPSLDIELRVQWMKRPVSW
jgi:hypothetical protein